MNISVKKKKKNKGIDRDGKNTISIKVDLDSRDRYVLKSGWAGVNFIF